MPAAGFHRSGCGCLTARAKEPWRVRRVGSDERTGEPRERKKQTPTTRTEAVTPSEHLSALGMTLEFVNRKLHNKLTRPHIERKLRNGAVDGIIRIDDQQVSDHQEKEKRII